MQCSDIYSGERVLLLSAGEGLFLYKDGVYIPPLGMIDDIASFSLSGVGWLQKGVVMVKVNM